MSSIRSGRYFILNFSWSASKHENCKRNNHTIFQDINNHSGNYANNRALDINYAINWFKAELSRKSGTKS